MVWAEEITKINEKLIVFLIAQDPFGVDEVAVGHERVLVDLAHPGQLKHHGIVLAIEAEVQAFLAPAGLAVLIAPEPGLILHMEEAVPQVPVIVQVLAGGERYIVGVPVVGAKAVFAFPHSDSPLGLSPLTFTMGSLSDSVHTSSYMTTLDRRQLEGQTEDDRIVWILELDVHCLDGLGRSALELPSCRSTSETFLFVL